MDALEHNRVYACESGQVRLRLEVNGQAAPCTLEPTAEYHFRVEIGCFDDPSCRPVRCQVISDWGKTVAEPECAGRDVVEFTVCSQSARYFYLRLTDEQGRKTWSSPVWTGREAEHTPENTLIPLDKTGCTAVDLLSGKDAAELICDDPERMWTAEGTEASVLIDLKRNQRISAAGHYPVQVIRERLKAEGAAEPEKMAGFLSGYRISASLDGERFEPCAEGIIRVFGAEEIIRFEPVCARYIRVDMLSTVGRESGLEKYRDARLTVGELTVFTDEQSEK